MKRLIQVIDNFLLLYSFTGLKTLILRKYLILSLLLNISGLFAQQVNRIISLAPSLTKNLYFLEVEDKLVGCTSYCLEAKKDNKEIIASAIKVNLEKLVALNPDLVIATTITSIETLETLNKFGIRTEVFPTPKSFEEICLQFQELGNMVGKNELASQIIEESKSQVKTLSNSVKKDSSFTVFFQIGAKPLFTVIPETFMDDYILYSGGINIAADLTRGSITRESVISRNPDVIFIVTMGVVGDQEKEIWKSYSNLSAAAHNRIYIIDADLSCSPTPITFVQTLEIMVDLLNE